MWLREECKYCTGLSAQYIFYSGCAVELSIGRSVSTVVQALGHFPFRQNFRFENLAISVVDQKSKSDGARTWYKRKQKKWKFLCKWNGNFRSSWLERKKWSTSEGCLFVPENFHLVRAFHLHFNRLNRKTCLIGKRPRSRHTSCCFHKQDTSLHFVCLDPVV